MNITRREMLKMLGMAGLGTTLFTIINNLPVAAKAMIKTDNVSDKKKLTKQWVRVIDLKKCNGCEDIATGPVCTNACRSTYYYPDDQEWIKVAKVKGVGGNSYWMPFPCMHCENAPCVKVCPVGASYHNEHGVVLVDQRRCIGCRLCMAACPYQRRYFNWELNDVPPKAALAVYSPEYPVPPIKGTASKCVFCAHFTNAGMLNMCIAGCPHGAMYIGDKETDVMANAREVLVLSKTLAENNAFRYKDELGTEPRVYYLPGYGQEAGRQALD
ncbi:MAG: 4Fe-4S dicluster domain-containing protein [Bacillota bacterium]